ncbi:MAG: hypothetical protein KF797_07265 [Flavobacteriales bacterium]|nr:hypothetical protein [Flavobacteriales bacterium]
MIRTAIAALSLALLLPASAQVMKDGFWQQRSSTASGGLEVGVPLREFERTWGSTTFGLSANIAIPMRTLPLEFGYDFAWGRMGSEVRTLDRPTGNIIGSRGRRRVDVKCSVLGHHALVRFNPLRGKLRPYGDAMLGARNFITRSTLTTEQGKADEVRDGQWVASVGWAAGLMYSFSRQIFVEGRVERLYNGKVDYVNPQTIDIASDGSVTYEKLSGHTGSLQIHLGVGLRF